MGVCQDLCLQVESVCGTFISNYARISTFNSPYSFDIGSAFENDYLASLDCLHPRYLSGTNGTCYNDLPVNVPVQSIDPLTYFQDGDGGDTDFPLPTTLDTPQFDTIFATIPPIINDDDDGNKMQSLHIKSANNSAILAIPFALLLFVLTLF
jgi:hypothetical protein